MSCVFYCRTFVGFLLHGQLHRRLTEWIDLAQINGHPVELLGDRRFIVRIASTLKLEWVQQTTAIVVAARGQRSQDYDRRDSRRRVTLALSRWRIEGDELCMSAKKNVRHAKHKTEERKREREKEEHGKEYSDFRLLRKLLQWHKSRSRIWQSSRDCQEPRYFAGLALSQCLPSWPKGTACARVHV